MIFPSFWRTGVFLLASLATGLCVTVMALVLKHGTEHYESVFRLWSQSHPLVLFIFLFSGLTLLVSLRKWAFRNRPNKGIREVLGALSSGHGLPSYKIPSHLVNGFLTVVTGGSTGIEVSTVVAAGAVGSQWGDRHAFFQKYRGDLICAGISAGITALFGTLPGGLFFVWEVFSKPLDFRRATASLAASSIAFFIVTLVGEPALFPLPLHGWHWHALPYFVALGLLAAVHSVYLTRCVLFCKSVFSGILTTRARVLVASLIMAVCISVWPALYGDGYHAVSDMLGQLPSASVYTLLPLVGAVLLLKPICTAVTLGGGGDGGVFAPSLFSGAFLGAALAVVANTVFDADVIPLNFAVAGMAAALSASIHAPLTALFAVCGIVGDYTLWAPIALSVTVSHLTAKKLFPFSVYTYPAKAAGN